MNQTINIYAGDRSDGVPVFEEVLVEPLSHERFRVERSPGLSQGFAAGDVIELVDSRIAKIVSRGGNVCIQVYPKGASLELARVLLEEMKALGCRLDGRTDDLIVLTVPVAKGFGPIEDALARISKMFPGIEWFYGNVYDPIDGVTPLNWWK